MYDVLIPNRQFRISPISITVPDYVSADGNKLSVDAIVYDGTPHLHVVKTIMAISGTSNSITTMATKTIKQILCRSRFGFGRIIISHKGAYFADPAALRNILAVVFIDNSCLEKELLQVAIPDRGPYKGIRPKYRTIFNPELYAAIMTASDTLIKSCATAQNQINPLWLDSVEPRKALRKTTRERGLARMAAVTEAAKAENKPAVTEEKSPKLEYQKPMLVPLNTNSHPIKEAGLSGLANIEKMLHAETPLLALIKQLASGKSLTIKISLD